MHDVRVGLSIRHTEMFSLGHELLRCREDCSVWYENLKDAIESIESEQYYLRWHCIIYLDDKKEWGVLQGHHVDSTGVTPQRTQGRNEGVRTHFATTWLCMSTARVVDDKRYFHDSKDVEAVICDR